SADRTIKPWDVAAGELRDTHSQPLKEQYAVAFSPDGKRLVAGGVHNRIRVWQISDSAAETTNPILESRFAHEDAILNLVFSADGRTLATAAADRTVKLWDATGPELKEKVLLDRQPDWAPGLTFALEDKALVVGRLDGSIEFYDTGTGKVLPVPKPDLSRMDPRGIQRGRQVRVKLIGSHLDGVTQVKSVEPMLKAELDPDSKPEPGGVWIRVTTPDELPRGAYELSVVGPGGESGRAKLHVDDLPQVQAPKTNQTFRLASLPADVWATHESSGDS